MIRRSARVDLSGFGAHRDSALNFLHYLALRRVDLRQLQRQLADLGLSSLGRAEGHTLYNLNAVLAHLRARRRAPPSRGGVVHGLTPQAGRTLLDSRARRLLGAPRPGRRTRIMVTLPSEAANDYRLVRALVGAGMDAARINCAHDDEPSWARMIAHVRRATSGLGRACSVEMDLAGPKVRTGALVPAPAVVKVRPQRDAFGRVVGPGRVWLTPADRPVRAPSGIENELPVDRSWLEAIRVPGKVRLTDARDATRDLRVTRRRGDSCEAEVRKTIYVTNGTVLAGRSRGGRRVTTAISSLPPAESPIRLHVGDRLYVTSRLAVGRRSPPGRSAAAPTLREVPCTLPEALAGVRAGHRIWFDDGNIGGVDERVEPRGLRVRITQAAAKGASLRADRGINLPDSEISVSSLTDEDLKHLPFVAQHADLVGFSFVRSARDVHRLRTELARLERPHLGVILKIETRKAFDELPAILLEALRGPPTGVMIARGDLAVEVGYERLAEVQEEILWLCEAAHLPVVWATEVLAGLAKSGLPTRAEVTDAAMGERAECVMLNKGPHVVEAVRALDSILRRMEAHQEKKSARLRHLAVAERFFRSRPAPAQNR